MNDKVNVLDVMDALKDQASKIGSSPSRVTICLARDAVSTLIEAATDQNAAANAVVYATSRNAWIVVDECDLLRNLGGSEPTTLRGPFFFQHLAKESLDEWRHNASLRVEAALAVAGGVV